MIEHKQIRAWKQTHELLTQLVELRSKRSVVPVKLTTVLHDAILTELEKEKRAHKELGIE